MVEAGLAEVLRHVSDMPSDRATAVAEATVEATKNRLWTPNVGQQTKAYFSMADCLLYGGAGGGGKTDLGIGCAFEKHQRSLLMRRKGKDLGYLIDRSVEVWGSKDGFNGSPPAAFNMGMGKKLEFGAAKDVGDELDWMGIPHDLLYIDEAAHFAEIQIRRLMGWVRTVVEGQRTRVILGSNPPLSDEGVWMIFMFAPWLDLDYPGNSLRWPGYHPIKAQPGELRYCIVDDDDRDIWVPGPGMYNLNGRMVRALSRTFIPALLKDNPYQDTPEYRAQQDGLPKHMRDAIRDGNFNAARGDHRLQVIPSEWIQAAMDRGREHPQPPMNVPMCAIAADMTGISSTESKEQDKFTIAHRYDGWYGKLVVNKANEFPYGKHKGAEILTHRRDNCKIILDMGGGYGDATYEWLDTNGHKEKVVQYKGSMGTTARTKESNLEFFNKRAEVVYRFYEALNPEQPGGSRIMLQPDEMLKSDLCSLRFDKKHDDAKVIKLEPKTELVKRLGRSTDHSDPVVYAWMDGAKIEHQKGGWTGNHNRQPKVVRGRANSARRQ